MKQTRCVFLYCLCFIPILLSLSCIRSDYDIIPVIKARKNFYKIDEHLMKPLMFIVEKEKNCQQYKNQIFVLISEKINENLVEILLYKEHLSNVDYARFDGFAIENGIFFVLGGVYNSNYFVETKKNIKFQYFKRNQKPEIIDDSYHYWIFTMTHRECKMIRFQSCDKNNESDSLANIFLTFD